MWVWNCGSNSGLKYFLFINILNIFFIFSKLFLISVYQKDRKTLKKNYFK